MQVYPWERLWRFHIHVQESIQSVRKEWDLQLQENM